MEPDHIMTYRHGDEDMASTSPDPCDPDARWFRQIPDGGARWNLWQEVAGGRARGLYSRVDGAMYRASDAERL